MLARSGAFTPVAMRPRKTPRRIPLSSALGRNLLLGLILCATLALGGFAPLDRFLSDRRFALAPGPVSGAIATVEIDAQSLAEVGVWPWPRALHAQLIDRLIALGARRIVFDVDFSSQSTPEGDRAFAEALRRAQGRVALAEFEQPGGANGRARVNAPIPLLAREAEAVAVDVPVDPDGVVRDYSRALDVGGLVLPIAGAWLARRGPGESFGIDYGLDLGGIARISAADVLAGRAPRILVAGHDIVIGASAEELRDTFMTPRYGRIPGLALHALAAETLLAGRALRPAPLAAVVALILALACAAGAMERRLSAAQAAASLALAWLGVEAGAVALQRATTWLAPTGGVDVALGVYALAGLVAALATRRCLHAEAARERDATRILLTQVVADNFDGVVVIGDDGRILAASQLARDMLGRALRGAALADLPPALAQAVAAALDAKATGGADSGEAELVARDGSARRLDYVVTVSRAPEAQDRRVVCLTFRDVTERRAHLARLDYLARHDETTGAWTRGELIAHLANGDGDASLFCVELRRFDLVNDVFGHQVGDRLLVQAVERLRGLGYPAVARLGDCSFAVARPGALAAERLAEHGAALIGTLARPYLIDGRPVIVGACLGATSSAISGRDPATLLTHASMAQAQAARRVGDVVEIFSPEMETRRRSRQALDAELRRAVADGSLAMHYQAKIELGSGRVIGAEALMRWRRASGEDASPTMFVPVAEESGLIVELGRFALRRACAQAAMWPGGVVAVNVSPVQFGLSDVFADVQVALLAAKLPPERLEIEITESAFADGDGAIGAALAKLRGLGVKIALDDFGTGYSSLHYLGRLPIDTIKIDQSFVRAMRREAAAAATVAAVVALAKAHGKTLVAEGVETAEDAAALAAMGCEYGQGYHFGPPQDAATFLAAIRASAGRAAA
jgi:predicted signal transduction protein with EAL and GGDEF domain/CHASE2 domain-containing sensor protein